MIEPHKVLRVNLILHHSINSLRKHIELFVIIYILIRYMLTTSDKAGWKFLLCEPHVAVITFLAD